MPSAPLWLPMPKSSGREGEFPRSGIDSAGHAQSVAAVQRRATYHTGSNPGPARVPVTSRCLDGTLSGFLVGPVEPTAAEAREFAHHPKGTPLRRYVHRSAAAAEVGKHGHIVVPQRVVVNA